MASPETHIDSSIDWLRRLVAFPTVSRQSNLDLIECVSRYLEGIGAVVRLTYDDERKKANLFATIAPGERHGVVLSGHTDVVPVTSQAWDSDPFQLVEHDGRLYGRGAADMKGFIAVALALAPHFAKGTLKSPIHYAFSYDEEVGCLGIGRLIDDLAEADIRPRSCIVGEPTMMKPIIAHKGKRSYRCRVRGLACHSAYAPQGVNAVEAAARAITYLSDMARRLHERGPYDHGFDIAHSTVHTGLIRGGTALNIVPNECQFEFEIRHLPGDDPAALLDEFRMHVQREIEPGMRAIHPDAGFSFETLSVMPSLDNGPEAEIVNLAQELSGNAEIGKVSFGTEASHFHKAGIPAVVCGPGSIEQAHKANEYVTRDQLVACERFMRRLVDRM